jgi:hypothetical protein
MRRLESRAVRTLHPLPIRHRGHAVGTHLVARGRVMALMWGLVLALLLQGLVMPRHAIAMATSTEVCSVDGGAKFVDADGHTVSKHRMDHDCCCPSLGGALPAAGWVFVPLHTPPQAQAPQAAARLAAQWLGPLSRGPPVVS